MSAPIPGSLEANLEPIKKTVRRLWLIGGAALVALVVVIVTYVGQFSGDLSKDQAIWGQFGDFVGGTLNPIFTFLSLLALLITITLQVRELHLSSTELKNSSTALATQSKTIELQQFENAFFQLLHLHNTIVNELDLRDSTNMANIISKGRDCFRVFVDRLRGNLGSAEKDWSLASISEAYEHFYKRNQHEVGHYFRLLYNIVKFVDRSSVKDKKFYTNLVRAQLSADELTLLFFNCLSRWGREKFKPLIEKYALLKTLPERPYLTETVRAYYDQAAYRGS